MTFGPDRIVVDARSVDAVTAGADPDHSDRRRASSEMSARAPQLLLRLFEPRATVIIEQGDPAF